MSERLTIPAVLLVLLVAAVSAAAGEKAKIDPAAVDRVLAELARGHARRGQLDALGPAGLDAVLERLLPESSSAALPKGVSEEQVERLIRQLGEADWKVYEAATAKLVKMGDGVKKYLARAAGRDGNASVRKRAGYILAALDPPAVKDVEKYANGLLLYSMHVRDGPRLEIMVKRAAAALKAGPPERAKAKILRACIGAVGRSGDDRLSKMLQPFLKDKDVRVAVLVVRCVRGSPTNNTYFPPLLLEALKSGRVELVDAAISQAPNCWDKRRKPEVRRLLKRIFEGQDERLKFHACFPLMHGYHDQEAMSYLLKQTQSKDKARARRAISWIGDSCNAGRSPQPGLVEKLSPYLKSPDKELRRVAADALGTYAGEAIVRELIPMLGEAEAIIVSETERNLLGQRDKAMVRRLLTEAAAKHEKESIRKKAGELLAKLDRK